MEKKESMGTHLNAAQRYMEVFDPFLEENPPYVPEDGAALHYSRVHYWIDDGPPGFCYYPEHKTVEDLKKESNMQYACACNLQGEKFRVKIYNYVHPGKEPGRNVQEDEYTLACMGALDSNVKELIEGELACEELLREMEPERRSVIEKEERERREALSLPISERQEMNTELFWNIIDEAKQRADPKNQEAVLTATRQRLMELSARAIADWHQIKREYMNLSDRNDLWKASAKICDHCTDDGFRDFRSWLISQGKDVFMQVLENPDSLESMDLFHVDTSFELYDYVAYDAYAQKKALEEKGLSDILKDYWEWVMAKGMLNPEKYLETLDTIYDMNREIEAHPITDEQREIIRSQTNLREDIGGDWFQGMMNMPC